MKKFSILVTLLLIIGMLTVSAFAAQTATVTVSTSSTTVHNGDTFTVTVDVSSVENCIAGGFMFNYNTDVFEYVSGSALVEGFTAAGVSTTNGNLAGYFMGNTANIQGSVFQITLKVKDNAALGNYTISGAANLVSKVAGVEEAVSCTVTAATIAITDAHECVPSDVVIENMVESTWDKVGTYDEVTYCAGCGEELSRVTKDAPLNPFYSNGMELNCQLTLNFVIKYDTLPFNSIAAINASGYYAVVTRIDAAGNRNDTTIPASAWQGHTKNRMRIPYSDWAPKQMTDALEIAIYDNNGEKISVVYETSVRGIAMSEIEQYIAIGGYDSYVTLLVDMLNYGTASQNNFGYNTGDCANALLPDEWKAYATPDVSYGARKDNSGVAFYQSTAFALESRVEMQLVLTNNFGVDRSQVVAEISYTTRTGKLVEKTVSGADFMPHTKGRFKLIIDWMDIPDCQQNVTIVFKDINGNELGTVTESVMSALGYYSELVPNDALYPAMIKFINSATAYFAG